jgi:hypothetical protein
MENKMIKTDSRPEMVLTANSLQGKQSVRATFRLPAQVINLLSVAASQLGLKQKSLFDHLVEDRNTLSQVADEARQYKPIQKNRRQKTFVISRNSLVALDHFAKKHKIPRDVLVEISIKRLIPVINAEQKKQKQRKLLLKDMEAYLSQGRKVLDKAAMLVGSEDQMYGKIKKIVSLCDQFVSDLHEKVEKGKRMDSLE